MKKLLFIFVCALTTTSAFSQFQVGRTKEQVKTDEANAKPKRIGVKLTLLTADYALYSLGNTEYLKYVTKGGMNTQIYETINFSTAQEQADFYKYVLSLFDEFKDNEVTLNGIRIIPHPMKLLGTNNIMFDVYPRKDSKYKNETVMFSKKAWIKLFENSRIHSL
ncbi:hypothetical protein TH53_17595 [Pedobacter lusitanus]|uniref:Contig77, whole genome shotgun sequence n=1 Tax=Pedobacter lusitanus TaxID=1503925 RepID=A0A0D0GFA2_9SPHI|nr:hypothetical protein [Pedobacter lusitanus]KIO75982.1 hypothetical protein TH53_17595 [Pedobacter lusitanus]